MQLTKGKDLEKAIERSKEIYEALKLIGKNDYADQLQQQIEEATEEKFVVGVIGSAKRGKSTLINGLLGQHDDHLAPIGKFPATNVVTIFSNSENTNVTLEFESGEKREISESEVKDYACEDKNPKNEKNVKTISVERPFSGLDKGVFIVDTPGANNALDEQHGEILYNYLPRMNALIFVLSSDDPIVESEQNILQAIRGNDIKKVFFALNKVDRVDSGDVDEDELEECIEHNKRVLNSTDFTDAKIYRISAKRFFEKKQDAGTEELVRDIKKLFEEEKGSILAEQLKQRAERFLAIAIQETDSELSLSKLSIEDIEKEKKELEFSIKRFYNNRSNHETEFRSSWEDSFQECEDSVLQIKKTLEKHYTSVVKEAKASDLKALASHIDYDLQLKLHENLEPVLAKCCDEIEMAQVNLLGSVEKSFARTPEIEGDGSVVEKSDGTNVLNIAGASAPALLTGVLTASIPTLSSNAIIASAPAVATGIATGTSSALSGIPLIGSWLAGSSAVTSGASAAATTATATAATAATGLGVILFPISIMAAGFAIYSGYKRWSDIKDKEKQNLIEHAVGTIDKVCLQVLDRIKKNKKNCNAILNTFNQDLDSKIREAEDKVAELLENRPSVSEISALERKHDTLARLEKN